MSAAKTLRDKASRRFAVRNDDGSLLLVILFTLMMTALILVATATMITGLHKTRDNRDYATALEAADTAFSDALIKANLGDFPTNPGVTTYSSGAPKTLGTVTWQWNATRNLGNNWTIKVAAVGQHMNRHFQATIKGTRVNKGLIDPRTGTLHYVVDGTENYEYGFFGYNGVKVATTNPVSQPNIDGYNGAVGTVGSDGTLTLGHATMSRIEEWGWTTDAGRCSGTYCPTTPGGSGLASMGRYPQTPYLTTVIPGTSPIKTIEDKCSTTDGAWKSSTNGSLPLVANHCYSSLTFDSSAPLPPLNGVVYVKGAVTVNSKVNVGTTANNFNAPSKNLRIATLGNFTQGTGSKIAIAVYAPYGTCSVNADPTSTSVATQTVWLGAATCKQLNISGSPRFRYDGGLEVVNDENASGGHLIWSLFDYQSLD